MVRIALIEDDVRLSEIYREYFAQQDCLVLSSIDPDIRQFIKKKSEHTADVLLLDLMLKTGNSLNEIPLLKSIMPNTKIIVLSSLIDDRVTRCAMDLGADGFLSKTSSLQYIKDAIIKSTQGGIAMSPFIIKHLLNGNKSTHLPGKYPQLTKKEIELIRLLRTGMPNKIAAVNMGVTFFTVNQHLKNIYKKLNINSKGELISLFANSAALP